LTGRDRFYSIVEKIGGRGDPRMDIPEQIIAAKIYTSTLVNDIVKRGDLDADEKRDLVNYLNWLISDSCADMADTLRLMAAATQKGSPGGPPTGQRGRAAK